MRFVRVKSQTQSDLQSLHHARERLVGEHTALVNHLRALLLERGIVVAQGRKKLEEEVRELLGDEAAGLSPRIRTLVSDLLENWIRLDGRIEAFDAELARTDEAMRRLATVPGTGPVNATALAAAVGDALAFAKGRDMAAWLGLVPRQATTGGKLRLLGISKRGNRHLRKNLVHGARAVPPGSPSVTRRSSAGCAGSWHGATRTSPSWRSRASWPGSAEPCSPAGASI